MAIDGMSHVPDQVPEPGSTRPIDEPRRFRAPDHDPEKAELVKAVGELASENADLYREINELRTELKTEKARFSAWATEVAKDKERTTRHLEEQKTINEHLAGQIAELQGRLTEKPTPGRPGSLPDRFEAAETPGKQTEKRSFGRLKPTNELISVGVTGGSMLLTVLAAVLGTPVAADAAGTIGNLLGVGAAVIALRRRRREGADADRSEG